MKATQENEEGWLSSVIYHMEVLTDMNTSDAQGYIEANNFYQSQAWGMGLNSEEAAEFIHIKAERDRIERRLERLKAIAIERAQNIERLNITVSREGGLYIYTWHACPAKAFEIVIKANRLKSKAKMTYSQLKNWQEYVKSLILQE
jgi:hypothetical protein